MAQAHTHMLKNRCHDVTFHGTASGRRLGCPTRPVQQTSRGLRLRVHASELVSNVTDSTFEDEVLKSSVPVLVDFWATWCGPCKLVAPTMDWVAKEYGSALKVVKVDADPNPAVIDKYKVQGLPTLILFKDGQKVDGSHWEGAITRKQLLEYLDKHKIVKAA